MAKNLLTRLVDDLDGTSLDGDGRSITFSLEGRTYDIDLSASNAQRFRDALAPFIAAARPIPSDRPRRDGHHGVDLAAVRAWARENGHRINERGRIPTAVLEAFIDAMP